MAAMAGASPWLLAPFFRRTARELVPSHAAYLHLLDAEAGVLWRTKPGARTPTTAAVR